MLLGFFFRGWTERNENSQSVETSPIQINEFLKKKSTHVLDIKVKNSRIFHIINHPIGQHKSIKLKPNFPITRESDEFP